MADTSRVRVFESVHIQLTCEVRFVPVAGVSQGSRFLSQFSIVGFGISPWLNRPRLVASDTGGLILKVAHCRLDSPAFRNVKPGIFAGLLIQIPQPHSSHHARSIGFPLSAFCVYVLGLGLEVWISAVLTNKCAECLNTHHRSFLTRGY
jgi:hypothetical protein